MHTTKPTISLIAAVDDKLGLGRDGKIPWYIKADLKHFKQTTLNHPVIMGRVTFESIGKPLPGRDNFVVSTQENFQTNGVKVFNNLDQAIKKARELSSREIFIIGGAKVYSQALTQADKIYLTRVEGSFDCDVFFPEFKKSFKLVEKSPLQTETYTFSFETWVRN